MKGDGGWVLGCWDSGIWGSGIWVAGGWEVEEDIKISCLAGGCFKILGTKRKRLL